MLRQRARAQAAAEDGNLALRRELASSNIKLAYYMAHRYKGIISQEEAISVALEALWTAALHYNPDRKKPFASYAGVVIANALRTAIRRSRLMEFACLHELIDPADPECVEERIQTVADPESEDWETRLVSRIDCVRIMREASPEGCAVAVLRDVYGYTMREACRMVGIRRDIGRAKRKEALEALKAQYA